MLEQSQVYNLYLRDTTISPNYVKVLALHQEVHNVVLFRFMILNIQET
jgi:hypothetical protein